MKFRKTTKKEITSEEILDQASKCKRVELENLLNQIQNNVLSENKTLDPNVLRAKIIITSRLASMRSK